MFDLRRIGFRGEDAAASYLKKKGFSILERNYRTRYGEIDIIARDRGDLVFVEVKTRRSASCGHPAEAVTAAKQDHIVRSALQYLKSGGLPHCNIRFDVVAIGAAGVIDHIPAAFSAPDTYRY